MLNLHTLQKKIPIYRNDLQLKRKLYSPLHERCCLRLLLPIDYFLQLHLFKNSHKTSTFRKGIKKALEITEKKEEKIEEVDLLFAEVVNESEGKDINTDDFFNQRFTPMCTPTKNRKELLGTFYLASLFD